MGPTPGQKLETNPTQLTRSPPIIFCKAMGWVAGVDYDDCVVLD